MIVDNRDPAQVENENTALREENATLRASLAEMVEFAGCHEMWQEDHPEYIVRACRALGIDVPEWIPEWAAKEKASES